MIGLSCDCFAKLRFEAIENGDIFYIFFHAENGCSLNALVLNLTCPPAVRVNICDISFSSIGQK